MQALSQLSYTPISVFFFVDHQRRIEIMKAFLSLRKCFKQEMQNNAKKVVLSFPGSGVATLLAALSPVAKRL